MLFRRLKLDDLNEVTDIIADAKVFLKRCGVPQWQVGEYPDNATFKADIQKGYGYVVTDDDQVVAVCAVIFDVDRSYLHLLDGQWLTDNVAPYVVIHRMAVSDSHRGKGIAEFVFSSVAEMAAQRGVGSVRIDTHEKNLAMQNALKKSGFTRCGQLRLADGDEAGTLRTGYEKLV